MHEKLLGKEAINIRLRTKNIETCSNIKWKKEKFINIEE